MGKGRGIRAAGLLLAGLLLLALPWTGPRAEEGQAEDMTAACAFSCTKSVKSLRKTLTDGKLKQSCHLDGGDVLTLRAPADMGTVQLRLCQLSSAFVLVELGRAGALPHIRVIRTEQVLLTLPLRPGCRQVALMPLGGGLSLSEVTVYGPGVLNDAVPHPEAAPDRVDFLIVGTHPDDEWVFLGGVYPLYGHERGYTGALACVTIPDWERVQECVNGMWAGGCPVHPYFLGFNDVAQSAPRWKKDRFRQEEVTLALVRLYRRVRPLVVVTQDLKGEYGHWQHILTAHAAFDAVALAADPAYDPASAAQYGPWTVQKVYQHLAQGMSSLTLDVLAPLPSYGGRTALEVAEGAFREHRTQRKTSFRPTVGERAHEDIRYFGLTWSTVGPDTGDDMFEHIDPLALAGAATPKDVSEGTEETHPGSAPEGAEPRAPAPSPAPTHTPDPTGTPAPSAPPAPVRSLAPTASPAPSAWDGVEARAAWAADHAGRLSAGIVMLLSAGIALKQYRRASRGKRARKE